MKWRFSPVLVLILISTFYNIWVHADIQICTDGAQNVFQISHASCPHGVLFMEPQTADCLVYTTEDELNSMTEDICTKDPYNATAKQFQYIATISKEEIGPDHTLTCKSWNSMCKDLPIKRVTADSFLKRVNDADFSFDDDNNATNADAVRAQTQRLFEYLMNLANINLDESLRVIDLFKISFEIFKKFTNPFYIREAFIEDVQKAFLFIFNEADSTRVSDVTIDEYNTIKGHLQECWERQNVFLWEGEMCKTYSVIQRVRKSGQWFTEFDGTGAASNVFGNYGLVVEASWGIVDFVHGLCYGTFRDNINSHHLYQRAMERLFTTEILYRWQNRFVFQGQQEIWNHFFSQNVKNALVNLDVAVQASYLSTPFLHRLERPIDGRTSIRKKRWAEIHAVHDFENIEGYCFQDAGERDNIVTGYSGMCNN